MPSWAKKHTQSTRSHVFLKNLLKRHSPDERSWLPSSLKNANMFLILQSLCISHLLGSYTSSDLVTSSCAGSSHALALPTRRLSNETPKSRTSKTHRTSSPDTRVSFASASGMGGDAAADVDGAWKVGKPHSHPPHLQTILPTCVRAVLIIEFHVLSTLGCNVVALLGCSHLLYNSTDSAVPTVPTRCPRFSRVPP